LTPASSDQGRFRNESLPPELLDQIKAVLDVIGPYISMTLEQFEIVFRLLQCYDDLGKA